MKISISLANAPLEVEVEGSCHQSAFVIDLAIKSFFRVHEAWLRPQRNDVVRVRPKKLLDIKDMPNFNSAVKNGVLSVSDGKIIWTEENYVTCIEHGACLCVNKERTIWRCPTCNEGAYVEW